MTSMSEAHCLVCGSGKTFTKNQILFCDGPGCDIPVHQRCYGVEVVPSGNWYCQRCEDRIPVDKTPACCCPEATGAFKRTNIPSKYIHVACAKFHPDLDASTDVIQFDAKKINTPANTACFLCKSTYGIFVKCHDETCSRQMHVTCGQVEDLMPLAVSYSKVNNATPVWCDVHKDLGVLDKIMKDSSRSSSLSSSSRKRRRGSNISSDHSRSSSRSPPTSGGRAATKEAKYYGELSDSEDSENGEEITDNDDDSDLEDMDEDEDEEMQSGYGGEDDEGRQSAVASDGDNDQGSSTLGGGSASRRKQAKQAALQQLQSRRRDQSLVSKNKRITSDDDDGAILGSSGADGARSSSGTVKKRKSKPTIPTPSNSTAESAAESQRKRLLMVLGQNKRRQSSTGSSSNGIPTGGMAAMAAMNIRTLGGVGPLAAPPPGSAAAAAASAAAIISSKASSLASTPSSTTSSSSISAGRPKLPSGGLGSLHNNLNVKGGPLSAGLHSPSLASSQQLSYQQTPSSPFKSQHGSKGSNGNQDMMNPPNNATGSAQPMPNSNIPTGATTTSLGQSGYARSHPNQMPPKQLQIPMGISQQQQSQHYISEPTTPAGFSPANGGNTMTTPSGSVSTSTSSSTSVAATLAASANLSASLAQRNPHTIGEPGQDLQYRYDVLQHTHAEYKIQNVMLRSNLKDLFGALKLTMPPEASVMEWDPDRLDDYVQELRDAIVGVPGDSSASSNGASTEMDPIKKRDQVVEKVLRELGLE